MLTEKDYCDYDTCVALKELGYVGSSRYYYTQRDRMFHCDAYNMLYTVRIADAMGYVLAVHLYDAQKWLREKGIFVHISHPLRVENDVFWNYEVLDEAWDDGKQNPCVCASGGLFDSYEDALQKGIEMAVRILKEGK